MRTHLKTRFRRYLNRIGIDLGRIESDRPGRDLILDVKRLATSMKVVFDVGANVGDNTLLYGNEFPTAQIFACEPSAQPRNRLLRRVVELENVRVLPIALGERDETTTINTHVGSDQNSLLVVDSQASRHVGADFFQPLAAETIEIKRLDRVVADFGVGEIDFLKIDTQGFELNVLRGAEGLLSEKRIKLILLEVNFVPLYEGQPAFGELIGFLDSYGYRFIALYNQVYRQNRYLMWADALFARTE
jgi:FkbM family methyltransferase